jgi:hypothetical protein
VPDAVRPCRTPPACAQPARQQDRRHGDRGQRQEEREQQDRRQDHEQDNPGQGQQQQRERDDDEADAEVEHFLEHLSEGLRGRCVSHHAYDGSGLGGVTHRGEAVLPGG